MHHIKAQIHNRECIKLEVVEGQKELGRAEKVKKKKTNSGMYAHTPKHTSCKEEVSTRQAPAVDKPLLSPQATETQH